MKFLMCRPNYFGIEYEINPWMHITNQVVPIKAVQQWETLYNILRQLKAKVSLLEPVPNLPDLVFTANAGLLLDDQIILSHFKHPERQLETPHLASWFRQAGYKVTPETTHNFEGAGDALAIDNKLFAGYGFRTDRAVYADTQAFRSHSIIYCELVNSYFYHLDTCFCPLNDQQAIWYPAAFSSLSQQVMGAELDLFAVPETEAKRFACNSVVLGQDIILPSGCPVTTRWLEQQGYRVHACDMSEFIKAGGACKCLTLHLD